MLQRAKLRASKSLQRILIFLQEFTANTIANGTSFNKQPAVCVRREFSGEGICLKKISARNVRGTRHPEK